MSNTLKTPAQILEKLGITALNAMQEAAQTAIERSPEVVVLSPTGSGKTLAFLLPLLAQLDAQATGVQVLIITPTRELAQQIMQVIREMGAGIKVDAVYGGRSMSSDRQALQHLPAVLVGTPGRVAAHLRRGTFAGSAVRALVLDEFDKSLEIGFEDEMKAILEDLTGLSRRVLTSATQGIVLPPWARMRSATVVDFLDTGRPDIALRVVQAPEKDKLATLYRMLCHLGPVPGIVFCSFKDAISRVSDYLTEQGVAHGCFHGSMEQADRELALLKLRNGSHRLLLCTDLAARGIDVPELQYIIHYHLPPREEEFTHRNGRTARMHRSGSAYVLLGSHERLPEYLPALPVEVLADAPALPPTDWRTLHVSAGRQDKLSKGDLAGAFHRVGELKREELGAIELHGDHSWVAVRADRAARAVALLDRTTIKRRKVRVRMV